MGERRPGGATKSLREKFGTKIAFLQWLQLTSSFRNTMVKHLGSDCPFTNMPHQYSVLPFFSSPRGAITLELDGRTED